MTLLSARKRFAEAVFLVQYVCLDRPHEPRAYTLKGDVTIASLAKLCRYISGITRGLLAHQPHRWRKLLGRSPYTVQLCNAYGFSVLVSVDDPAISRPLLCIGEYERHVTQTLLGLLQPETQFLDIGANIGFFTLLAAARCPSGKIYSFEPDATNRRLLQASIALNGFEERVVVYPFAVSNEDERLSFSDLDNPGNLGARFTAKESKTLERHAPSGHPGIQQVEAVRIDRVLAGEHIDLVKIDIEGFEPLAFEGMAELIDRCRPTIVSEFAPGTIRHISGRDPRELLDFFKHHHYAVSVIETDGTISEIAEGTDVMNRFANPNKHHVDLLVTPQDVRTSD